MFWFCKYHFIVKEVPCHYCPKMTQTRKVLPQHTQSSVESWICKRIGVLCVRCIYSGRKTVGCDSGEGRKNEGFQLFPPPTLMALSHSVRTLYFPSVLGKFLSIIHCSNTELGLSPQGSILGLMPSQYPQKYVKLILKQDPRHMCRWGTGNFGFWISAI